MSRTDTRTSPSLRPRHAGLLLFALAAAVAGSAWARSSDRNQEIAIDAGRQTGSLSGSDGVSNLSGGVHISQGSLDVTSSTARITLVDGEPTRAVFSGDPVVLKQVMDDGTPMTARATGVDYNLKTEIVVFTGGVSIEQPRGSMSGERVVYNLKTGSVDSGGEGSGRVKMRILPRSAQPATAGKAGGSGGGN